MTFSLAGASVNPTAIVSNFTINTSAPKNETSSQAVNIGNLTEESTVVSVSDQGAAAGNAVSTTFTANDGDLTTLSQSFGNVVDQADTQYQLYDSSGNLIADNLGDTDQQNAYAEWVNGGLTVAAGQYTAIATPQSAVATTISTSQNQGTSLSVSSSLTGSDTTEYYNFDLTAGNNIKLGYDAQSSETRVQLYNSSGNLIADSQGNAFEQANYIALTSGTGLTALPGSYSIEVSYAPGADTTTPIPYSFQLYSGSTYSVLYQNNVTAQPYDNSAAGSVTATTDSQLYSRQGFNEINATALNAINIGWLAQDKSSLQVESQLTSADSTDYYSLTLQTGDNLKFGFDTTQTPNASDLRVQIYDRTGSYLIADSEGTAAQKAAYAQLTSSTGLSAGPGGYLVKVSYANGAPRTTNGYTFNLYSGTSYSAVYKTIASAQTYGNFLAGGGNAGYSAAAGFAAYLAAASNGTGNALDILSALSESV